jgi:hypothetical protein
MLFIGMLGAVFVLGAVAGTISDMVNTEKPKMATTFTRVSTKVTSGIVDVDPNGNIIRITDASGRVVYEEGA